ncbi:MAG TPA: zinc ABC transporter substrate-binding protein [Bacteroidales bacterium]|nr:zinc ABC transporter substrate-binding protein [Bacteroidales bacterium]
MKRYSLCLLIALLALVSCGRRTPGSSAERVITVTIPPFEWFVEQIGGDDFLVNVLLPPGADHHIWEPLPAQINALSGSEALIMNGQLGFEHAWMDRFMQVNPGMKVLDLSRNIELIMTEDADQDDGDHEGHDHGHGGPDPHYWMSPSAARIMARDIRNFLTELNPASAEKYDSNLAAVNRRITEVDSLVRAALGHDPHRTVMIFHPALAYMGRDYGFEQVSFEDEGKSPSPARMKELIDLAREKEIKIIFIQAEYDVRNAQSLSIETGAELIVINPMNSEWPEAVMEVAKAIGQK